MRYPALVIFFMSILFLTCKEEKILEVVPSKIEIEKSSVESITTDSIQSKIVAEVQKVDEKVEVKNELKDTSEKIEVEIPKKRKVKKKQAKKLAKIQFESESFDFGRIVQGEEVLHEFKFTNAGDAPLVINDAVASCGCTQPIYPFIPIEVGETGKILVQFKSKGRLGRQAPTIKVFTNAVNKSVILKLNGEVATEKFQDTIPLSPN